MKVDEKGYALGPSETLVSNVAHDTPTGLRVDDLKGTDKPILGRQSDHGLAIADLRTGSVRVCRLETWTTLVLLERTAAAFGRTDRGWHILYITRDGGIINPPTGDVSGGKVLAYDTWGVDVY